MSTAAHYVSLQVSARWMRGALIAAIRVYQLVVSPLLAPACRYEPSCSGYAVQAITRHGAIRGIWLAMIRIARCHPWGRFGYDPVP